MKDQVQQIPLDQIVPPAHLLRFVDKESIAYEEFLESVRQVDFLNSISVRVSPRQPGKYEIIDGLHRYSIAQDLRLETIPCIIKEDRGDFDVLVRQIQANAIRPETHYLEYAKHLERILLQRPKMSLAELAELIGKSPTWVSRHLSFIRLIPQANADLVAGLIPVRAALALVTLPPDLQEEYLPLAYELPMKEFGARVAECARKFCAAKAGKRLARFYRDGGRVKPQPYLRRPIDIQKALGDEKTIRALVQAEGCKNVKAAFKAGLKWCLHLDKRSVQDAQDKLNSALERRKRNLEKRRNNSDNSNN